MGLDAEVTSQFGLSAEQEIFKGMLDRAFAGFGGVDRSNWARLAETGAFGAGIAEDLGGFGGGATELALVCEAAGRAGSALPVTARIGFAAQLLGQLGRRDLLEPIVSGERIVALADPLGGLAVSPTGPVLRDGRVTGEIDQAIGGAGADAILAPLWTDTGDLLLACLPTARDGVTVRDYRLLDGHRAARLSLREAAIAEADILARGAAARAALLATLDHALSATAAEAVGIAGMLFETTLAYLKTRAQFGQPIGRFQAVQHRMADVLIALEEARSLAMWGQKALDGEAGSERAKTLSSVYLGVMQRSQRIGREAIQLHGGIGFTEELPVGSAFRRLKALSWWLGDREWHLDRITGRAP